MKALFELQFGYCPLIWIFHSRGVNNKINHLQERLLPIVYKDNISSLEDSLKKNRSFTIHQRNFQSLAIELFKFKENLSNSIMYDIFQTRKINYNLRSQTDFASICVNTNKFGLNSLRYFASKVWSMVQLEIRNSSSVEIFKTKIRNWEPKNCYCHLCKTYVNNLGFVNVIQMSFFIVKKMFLFLYMSIVLVDIFAVNILICFMFCKTFMLKV